MSSILDKLRQFTREALDGPQTTSTQPVSLRYHKARAATMRLRTYQVTGVEWLRTTKRAILADAPGVGKTFQACEAAELPCIVTCPSLLIKQWQNFLLEQYPGDPIQTAEGDVIERQAAIDAFKSQGGWLIVNHDMWRRFAMPPAETLIVDESHHFKNHKAKRSVFLRHYAHKVAPRVYELTATPVHKDASDLWHQLHIIDPKTWHSYWRFVDTHLVTMNYGYGTKILKVRNQKALNEAIKPYILERTAKQVRLEMPAAPPKKIELTLDPASRKAYNRLRDFYRYEEDGKEQILTNAGAVLHALRRLLVTPGKITALKQIIDDTPLDRDASGNLRPIVVFTAYRETANVLAEHINADASLGGAVVVTGVITDPETRRELAMTGGPQRKRVRICTADAITEGIDLSHSRTVIWFEGTYVPGKRYQCMSRVLRHRNGEPNDEPVVMYDLLYQQTADTIVYTTVTSRTQGNALSVLREALLEG